MRTHTRKYTHAQTPAQTHDQDKPAIEAALSAVPASAEAELGGEMQRCRDAIVLLASDSELRAALRTMMTNTDAKQVGHSARARTCERTHMTARYV